MFKRILKLSNLIWALAIFLALAALTVGFAVTVFTGYDGDTDRPVMDLRENATGDAIRRPEKDEVKEEDEPKTKEPATALRPDGTLHPLAQTTDAGQEYADSLTYLVDSSFIRLRSLGLTTGPVWSSETGLLAMGDTGNWSIRYPGDGSFISPASAATIAKPEILVIAVGSDGIDGLDGSAFIANYESLIRDLSEASPDTIIVCLSLSSVTAAYVGTDGLNAEKAAEINGWIKTVCIDTGAYYGDLGSTLCSDGNLLSEYADGTGRSLNSTGLRAVLSYLRNHNAKLQ